MQTLKHISLNGYPARFLHIYNPNKPSLVFLPGAFMGFNSLKYYSSRFSQAFNYFVLELLGTGDLPPCQLINPLVFWGIVWQTVPISILASPFIWWPVPMVRQRLWILPASIAGY